MSKTTKKLGKPTLHLKNALTANTKPSKEAVQQQRYLNQVSQRLFKGAQYFSLTEKQRSFIHEVLNWKEGDSGFTDRHENAQMTLSQGGLL